MPACAPYVKHPACRAFAAYSALYAVRQRHYPRAGTKQELAASVSQGSSLLQQLSSLHTTAPAASELAEMEGELAALEDELVQLQCV